MILTPPPGDPAVAADIPSRRNDGQEVFDLKSDNYMAWLAGFRNWLASFRAWTVTARDEVNQLRAGTDTVAQEAASANASALATAGFKGAWSSLAGPLAPPASVFHDQQVWLLLAPVAEVQAQVPGVSANWVSLGAANLGGVQQGLRNKIINGKFEHAQRGTSFATPAGGSYGLDRVCHINTTAAAYTVSQEADGPPGGEFRTSLRYTVTAADASITGTKQCYARYWVEGYDARDLIGRPFILSFWVRSSVAGTHCVSLKNTANDRSLVLPYTVAVANNWTRIALAVPQGLITAGGWNWTNGQGLGIDFILAAAPQYQGAAGDWLAAGVLATAQQANVLATVGNVFAITGLQLERGRVATPFEHRALGLELVLCQRYFEVIARTDGYAWGTGIVATSSQVWASLPYRTDKRAAPSIRFIGDPTYFQFQLGGGTGSCTSLPFPSVASLRSAFVIYPSTSAGLNGDSRACLMLVNNQNRIEIDGEL